jgi:prevent-host-death family protein
MITVTAVEAQNRFGRLIDMAQREAVAVTRHGRPAAFIVSPKDMEELLDSRSRRSRAVADLKEWDAAARAEQSTEQAEASAALTDEEVSRMVHEPR